MKVMVSLTRADGTYFSMTKVGANALALAAAFLAEHGSPMKGVSISVTMDDDAAYKLVELIAAYS